MSADETRRDAGNGETPSLGTDGVPGEPVAAEEAREAVDEERTEAVGIPESVTETEQVEGLHSVEEERQSGAAAAGPQADRYQALLDKRREAGLSDEEADELGRLMAEREGQSYANRRSDKLGDDEGPETP